MHFVERIGPVLGIAAFLGLAILAFLLFLQARDIRRLREWAGRAPERAQEAAEASLAAAEARGEVARAGGEAPAPSGWRHRVVAAIGSRLGELERRSPIRLWYPLGALVVALVAVGVVTGGFGLGGGEQQQSSGRDGAGEGKPQVSVLNGTTTSGLADRVQSEVVKSAGYRAGAVTNAGSSAPETVVMFGSGHRDDARALATAVRPKLGQTPIAPITDEVRARAEGAPLVLVLGLDDANFGAPAP